MFLIGFNFNWTILFYVGIFVCFLCIIFFLYFCEFLSVLVQLITCKDSSPCDVAVSARQQKAQHRKNPFPI